MGKMTKILIEEQQRSFPALEEPIREEEYDAKELKDLVMKEDESTSLESHEKIKDDIVKTTPEMAPWGEIHEELKNEKITPISKIEECTMQLYVEVEATIVNKKIENKKIMLLEDYVLKLLIEHKYRLLGKDGGKKHQHIRSW